MFFGLANTLRSLTASPITHAINEARRMARRRLETGGAVSEPSHVSRRRVSAARAGQNPSFGDFVLPRHIDPEMFATALVNTVEGLPRRIANPMALLKHASDGRRFIPREGVVLIGEGNIAAAQAHLRRLINDVTKARVTSGKRGR